MLFWAASVASRLPTTRAPAPLAKLDDVDDDPPDTERGRAGRLRSELAVCGNASRLLVPPRDADAPSAGLIPDDASRSPSRDASEVKTNCVRVAVDVRPPALAPAPWTPATGNPELLRESSTPNGLADVAHGDADPAPNPPLLAPPGVVAPFPAFEKGTKPTLLSVDIERESNVAR